MALYKRCNVWWISISHNKRRIQQSTGTSDKLAAQQFHDKFKANLWKNHRLQEKPDRSWKEAVIRWLTEAAHKKSINDDKRHLFWLDPHLGALTLKQINRDLIDHLANVKLREGVRPSTVNRMLEVLRALLRKAEREWEWIDKAPYVRMLHEENRRIRWITREEAARLLKELPPHLATIAAFALVTGLRQANVLQLQWDQVDLLNRHALIHPDQAKAKKAIPVPLNSESIALLERQIGLHERYVFVYRGKPIKECNTKAWRNALARAGIENFRWHDLRHTWASWHVQSGTSLQELQQLGGWSSFEMVLRYAHLSSEHLRDAAERISKAEFVTNLLHSEKFVRADIVVC